jgi:hypothetical protein
VQPDDLERLGETDDFIAELERLAEHAPVEAEDALRRIAEQCPRGDQQAGSLE